MAGHSKWANIQHRKGKQDAKRGKVFTKLAREITVAAKMGGPDADANPRLRAAIAAARKESMPNDNIKRALDKGSGTGDADNIEEIVYEGYGPSGVAFIVEAVTDNKNRTTPEMRHMFSKAGGNMGEAGSVAWQFEKKGYIQIPRPGRDEDALTELVLEIDAEDYEATSDDFWGVITAADQLHAVLGRLEQMEIEIESAKLEMIPTNEIPVTGDDLKSVLALMEKFDDHDDVQNVWNNADFDPAELDA